MWNSYIALPYSIDVFSILSYRDMIATDELGTFTQQSLDSSSTENMTTANKSNFQTAQNKINLLQGSKVLEFKPLVLQRN